MPINQLTVHRLVASVPVLIPLLIFQNCAPYGFEAANQSGHSHFSSEQTLRQSKADCQFIGPEVIKDRIQNLLEISSGDVPVLNAQGRPTSAMRLAQNIATLGKGDIAKGKPDDFACGATKYKASIEIMIDACTLALATPPVQAKLFPAGLTDFDALYRSFVGRSPTSYEAGVLHELVDEMASSKAEAAACGAVASSLEALIRI